jgi:hypothetical protein
VIVHAAAVLPRCTATARAAKPPLSAPSTALIAATNQGSCSIGERTPAANPSANLAAKMPSISAIGTQLPGMRTELPVATMPLAARSLAPAMAASA